MSDRRSRAGARQPKRESKQAQPKLRKQPQLTRVNRTARYHSTLELPNTVRQRRRHRRRQSYARPLSIVQSIFTSSRWISGALLLTVIYGFYFLTTNLNFYLNVIPVEGLFSISAGEVVAQSDLAGKHIFAADPAAAAQQISDSPGIISAEVTLAWPNRVKITVEEETPIAVWKNEDGLFWVNPNGQLFPARREMPGLVIIEAPGRVGILGQTRGEAPAIAGEDDPEAEIDSAEEAAEAVDTEIEQYGIIPDEILHGALQLQRLRPGAVEDGTLAYSARNGLSFRDSRGWDVYLGTGIDMEQKLVVYDAIIETLLAQADTPAYVNVANQHRPFYKSLNQ